MENLNQSASARRTVRLLNVALDGSKRLDIALRGLHGVGPGLAHELALGAMGLKGPRPAGEDTLGLLPKLGALDQGALAALAQRLGALPVEGALRDQERARSEHLRAMDQARERVAKKALVGR